MEFSDTPCRCGGRLFLSLFLRLLNQSFDGGIDFSFSGAAKPAVPDDALVVQDEERRRTLQIKGGADLAHTFLAALFRERAPIQLLLVHHFFELFNRISVGIDADQSERLAFQVFDERPLVGP